MRFVSSCVGYHQFNPVTLECKHCFAKAKTIFEFEAGLAAKRMAELTR